MSYVHMWQKYLSMIHDVAELQYLVFKLASLTVLNGNGMCLLEVLFLFCFRKKMNYQIMKEFFGTLLEGFHKGPEMLKVEVPNLFDLLSISVFFFFVFFIFLWGGVIPRVYFWFFALGSLLRMHGRPYSIMRIEPKSDTSKTITCLSV